MCFICNNSAGLPKRSYGKSKMDVRLRGGHGLWLKQGGSYRSTESWVWNSRELTVAKAMMGAKTCNPRRGIGLPRWLITATSPDGSGATRVFAVFSATGDTKGFRKGWMFMYITLVGIKIQSDILQSQEKHTESCIFLHLQNVKTNDVSKELPGVHEKWTWPFIQMFFFFPPTSSVIQWFGKIINV